VDVPGAELLLWTRDGWVAQDANAAALDEPDWLRASLDSSAIELLPRLDRSVHVAVAPAGTVATYPTQLSLDYLELRLRYTYP
jgi:hypothetical protein